MKMRWTNEVLTPQNFKFKTEKKNMRSPSFFFKNSGHRPAPWTVEKFPRNGNHHHHPLHFCLLIINIPLDFSNSFYIFHIEAKHLRTLTIEIKIKWSILRIKHPSLKVIHQWRISHNIESRKVKNNANAMSLKLDESYWSEDVRCTFSRWFKQR